MLHFLYMINKCMVCGKDFESLRSAKKTCSDSCRQKLHRGESTVTEIIPIVTKKDSTVTKKSIVTKPVDWNKLVFTTETLEERIEMYKKLNPDYTFVPNWIAHGYNSKEEALAAAIKAVNESKSVKNSGLI